MSLEVSLKLMIIKSWVISIELPIRSVVERVSGGQVSEVIFSGNDLLTDGSSNFLTFGDLVHHVGAVLLVALWVSNFPDSSTKLSALVNDTKDLVKGGQVLESE